MNISNIAKNTQALLVASELFEQVQSAPQEGETLVFEGYPAAFHYYENTESEPATVSQRRRAINYTVQIVMHSDADTSLEDEFAQAYELIDAVIQKFDESQDLSVGELPRECDILRPVPGELSRVSTDLGDGLMATIRLTCEGDVAFK